MSRKRATSRRVKMSKQASSGVATARDYYNSHDADTFYDTVWGGEDIHVGIYRRPEDTIFEASRRTVAMLASLSGSLKRLGDGCRVLDLGAGVGGSARYLARNVGCEVVALNLSETENERHRRMNRQQGLDHLIEVVDGNFEEVPYPDGSFDLVWSQDAILHSSDREAVLAEAFRVLGEGGEMVLTDPMQTEDCYPEYLKPILKRIFLESLATPSFYLETAATVGFGGASYENQPQQLVNHYSKVLEETEAREDELRRKKVSDDYLRHMRTGLRNWVVGGSYGHLTWGMFFLRK
jgi:sarcosine/dimethylglycine N-methyltransferase